MATSLQLIQNYTKKEDEGAARVRVLACGFILNLTNECGKSHTPNLTNECGKSLTPNLTSECGKSLTLNLTNECGKSLTLNLTNKCSN